MSVPFRCVWMAAAALTPVFGGAGFAGGLVPVKAGSYRETIEARAAQAVKDKDVQALVECAFALYPLEVAAKEPRHAALLGEAANLVVAKQDAAEAKRFLEVAAPLVAALPETKRDQLTALAVGKSAKEVVKEESERIRGSVKKVGPDLADPEVKSRGGDEDLAKGLGHGVLWCIRPSHKLADSPARLGSYKLTYPGTNRVTVYIRMNWHGAWTNSPYESDIHVKFLITGKTFEVLGIDYTDNCLFPRPDQTLLNALIRELNRQFAENP